MFQKHLSHRYSKIFESTTFLSLYFGELLMRTALYCNGHPVLHIFTEQNHYLNSFSIIQIHQHLPHLLNELNDVSLHNAASLWCVLMTS